MTHRPLVSQSFTAPADEWTPECSCGWTGTPAPHDDATRAAAEHAAPCPDCADNDHHACIGEPECHCPCNDLAERENGDER